MIAAKNGPQCAFVIAEPDQVRSDLWKLLRTGDIQKMTTFGRHCVEFHKPRCPKLTDGLGMEAGPVPGST
jgi:hypothetical protein